MAPSWANKEKYQSSKFMHFTKQTFKISQKMLIICHKQGNFLEK